MPEMGRLVFCDRITCIHYKVVSEGGLCCCDNIDMRTLRVSGRTLPVCTSYAVRQVKLRPRKGKGGDE
jgi:hypothetical protein